MTLLQKRDAARQERRLQVRADTRHRLRVALAELLPGARVILFGSLTRPGRFNDRSDIDLALEQPPRGIGVLRLLAGLMERLGKPVDIVPLDKYRFRAKILREGERWTL